MLQLPQVPVQHAGTMTAYLLHNSEHFFPPLNAATTLSNLILTVTSYLNRDGNRDAAVKLPYFAASFLLNMATTAWALGIMVPMNKQMAVHAKTLEQNSGDERAAKELRRLQQRWTKLNYGKLYKDMRGCEMTDSNQAVPQSCSAAPSPACTPFCSMVLLSACKRSE